jgi:hypothetical protein
MGLPRSSVLAGLGLGLVLLSCGSEQSKMERGAVVDQEEAVPGTGADYDESEAERRAREEAEVEKKEQAEMQQNEQENEAR